MFLAYWDPNQVGYVLGTSGFLAYILAACAAVFGVILLRLKQIHGFFKKRFSAVTVEVVNEPPSEERKDNPPALDR